MIPLTTTGLLLLLAGCVLHIWNSCEVTDRDEIAAHADSFRVSAHEQKEAAE